MSDLHIADAQVHIWAAPTPERPWLPPGPDIPAPHKPVPFTKDDLLREMDAAGVDRAVLVTPLWEGYRNDLMLAAAQAHPERFGVMGRLDPLAPDSRGRIATWLEQPGMLGLRLLFRPAEQHQLIDGSIDWLWPAAERAGVPLMVFARHADLHFIDRVAERCPGLKLTIDHFIDRSEAKSARSRCSTRSAFRSRGGAAVNSRISSREACASG
jgi:predicted TIM-barrel fold metal-dependent hydrolase